MTHHQELSRLMGDKCEVTKISGRKFDIGGIRVRKGRQWIVQHGDDRVVVPNVQAATRWINTNFDFE